MTHSHRIVLISDTHLGAAGGPERQRNAAAAWGKFQARMSVDRPDLVVITGDVVVHDPDDMPDQLYARELVAGLGVPVVVVPGNHDVGDHAIRTGLPRDWHGPRITSERVENWERIWGPSFWLRDMGGWSLLGLNSQLFGSGLQLEEAQWTWLQEQVIAEIASRPVIVFMHEALHLRPENAPSDNWMSVPTKASEVLVKLLGHLDVRLVASGHTHRYLEWEFEGLRQVTAPSLTGPIPVRGDMDQPQGTPVPGWLELGLTATELEIGIQA